LKFGGYTAHHLSQYSYEPTRLLCIARERSCAIQLPLCYWRIEVNELVQLSDCSGALKVHREGSDIAWEVLRRWLGRKGAKPAALIEMAKSLHGAERAVRNALEIVL
jgi:hypothetical protein